MGGTLCQKFVSTAPRGTTGRMNDNISFYWDPVLQKPVRWWQFSRPVAFSSHTDEYIFEYMSFDATAPRNEDLRLPQACLDAPAASSDLYVGLKGLVSGIHSSAAANSHDQDGSLFEAFQRQNGKSYSNAEEAASRRTIFLNNLRTIRELNAKHAGKTTFKGYRFLDLTPEEVMSFRGGKSRLTRAERVGTFPSQVAVHEKTLLSNPRAFDWRVENPNAIGRVKDQGFCGSCWTFGALGPVEAHHAIQTGHRIELAEQFLVDCAWSDKTGSSSGNHGCDGGDADIAIQEMMRKYGGAIPSAQSYGSYQSINGYCKDIRGMQIGAWVKQWVEIPERDEEGVMDALVRKGPLSVNIMVPDELHYYDSGVINTPLCKNDKSKIDHAVVLVGYGTDDNGVDYWTIRNSWSTYWGEQGYVRIARGENDCAIASDAGYPIVESLHPSAAAGVNVVV